ncbi:hypothetical protein [Glaciimonas immobilis]|uniref:Uncharacterized protein n=1 Tax=Glaciimonas immobilis TaxID=728004 RepID=A0A840RPQ0_9BURK|nr:hypothetical protein [Glaciimonas immobilis]MBB5198479.1 hypothetical protein [Glaciimonas immobilis]
MVSSLFLPGNPIHTIYQPSGTFAVQVVKLFERHGNIVGVVTD